MTFTSPIEWEQTLPIRQSSPTWSVTVRAYYGAALSPAELEQWRALTGRDAPPEGGYAELLVVAGRRAGKSETIARLATYEAIHGGHEAFLAPGQVGLIAVISPLREQSQEILGYVRGLADLPANKPYVERVTKDGVLFKTGIEIRVMTADAVNVSGPTVVMAILDEAAKLPGDDAVMPDRVIVDSLRPALAPLLGAPRRRFVMITSAYIKEGIAFETDRDHFGKSDSDVLVVRGTTADFNPNIDTAWLERERRRVGERVFAREYGGEWQDASVESWFGLETVNRSVDKGRGVLAPKGGNSYIAAIDLGFRQDGTALAIAHREYQNDRVLTVIDGVWYWPGGTAEPSVIVHRSAKIIREYGARAFADQFGFDAVKDSYASNRVRLIEARWDAMGSRSKTEIFNRVRREMLDGRVRLPDDPELTKELHKFGGRLRRNGTEELAARSGHDDRVHACVAAIFQALETQPDRRQSEPWTRAEYVEAWTDWNAFCNMAGCVFHHEVFNRGSDNRCLSFEEYLEWRQGGHLKHH